VASGLFHVGIYVVLDGSWEGPVSWRKPIEFGLSGGITTLSLAAVMGRLPRTGWLAWPCAVAISFFVPETALIDLQRWRGVPSHFNNDTPFDATIFTSMGALVGFVSLAIILMTIWSFISLRGPGSSAFAIRAGMVFLTIGQLLGFAILANGFAVDDVYRASIFGAAGEMKLPHAVALHGLQVLGLLALLLERATLPESRRLALTSVAVAGYALALTAATVQTFAGRAPLDLTPPILFGGATAALMLGIAYLVAARAAGAAAFRWRTPAN